MDTPTEKSPDNHEEESQTYEHPHHSSPSFHIVSVVLLVLIYGSSLLINQVDSLYRSHHKTPLYNFSEPELPVFPENESGKIPLSFKLVKNGTFGAESREIQWIQTPNSRTNDTGDYVVTKSSQYILKSMQNPNVSKILYKGKEVEYEDEKYDIEDVVFSDDLKRALILCDKIHNWRHSFFASYFVYDIESEELQALYDVDTELNKRIALAKWSPDSSKIAFVLENNVFVKDISNFTQPIIKKVTTDGGKEIFYGKPDWVYEEEVFESDTALWWSPDSEYLSMLRSNDTQVPEYPIPYFVQDNKLPNDTYPELRMIKYPKAGYPNPVVDFLVYDVKEDRIEYLDPKDSFYHDSDIPNETRLITEMIWVGDSQLLIRTTNRVSDILKVFIVNVSSDKYMNSVLARSENVQGTNDWFEIEHNTLYVPKSEDRSQDGYIDLVTINGYNHLVYYSPPTASSPKYVITSGEWEVDGGAASFDYLTNKVYYISTEKSSTERHLYSVNLDGTDKQNMTDISEEGWYSASFSKGSRYLLLSYQGPSVPYQKIVDLHEGTEEVLVSNDKLAQRIQKYDLPVTTFGVLRLSNGADVNYKQTFPLHFDPSRKYPLLFFVYGGPGSQLVQKTYGEGFSEVVAAELDAIVVTVDGRGTGFKGKEFRNIVKDNLSHYEVIDQIAAAKLFVSKPYIDSQRTAIWGWSYGGFMTLKTLEADAGNVFKYGMAVAPVTNWGFYDSIYTERYMHTPQQNGKYLESSVHDVEGFKGVKRFLLMHGTGDDNVHFQNSMKFLDMLDQAGIENYDVHVFPDSDHSISYHNANVIIYDKLFNWLKRAFSGMYDNYFFTEEPERYVIDENVNLYH